MDKNTTKEYELDIEKFKKICEINSPKGIVFRQGNIPSPESRGTLMSLGCPPYETSVLGYFSNDFFYIMADPKADGIYPKVIAPTDCSFMFKGFVASYTSAHVWNEILEYIDVSGLDTSNTISMTAMFECVGYYSSHIEIDGLNTLDTYNVVDFSRMFCEFAHNCTGPVTLDFKRYSKTSKKTNSKFTVENGKHFRMMFMECAEKSSQFELLGLENWDTKNAETMNDMFNGAGTQSKRFIMDLSEWNTSNVWTMAHMFKQAGKSALQWDIGDISRWDVSSCQEFQKFFKDAGITNYSKCLNLTKWNVKNVMNHDSFYRGFFRVLEPKWT